MKRGIYLVANLQSQEMCENLVYSIRQSGCTLPIRIIHFGGSAITSAFLFHNAELLRYENFEKEAQEFVANLRSVLTECPLGFLYRFLAWFSDWDEFIYSDNDIVALTNWEEMFEYLNNYDLVHADEEYTTKGIYNYEKPTSIQAIFGETALETAMTAGHMVVKRNDRMVSDINDAVTWFKENSNIPKKHDQSLLHIATLLGDWKTLNLCKPPYNWLSSWAGDYKNSLQLIQNIQSKGNKISHIHYSGGAPHGNLAIEDLLLSNYSNQQRLKKIASISIISLSGYLSFRQQFLKIKKGIIRRLKSNT
jgi:hypothetical protein